MHGFLSIFSQNLLELKCVGSPTGGAILLEGRASHCPYPFQVICPIKQLFRCLDLTFQWCPPYDSSSHRPPASYSQWSSRYRPAIIWTGDRGGDRVSIELPLAALRTNPPNGEADGWLTTSIDILLPAGRPLSHLLHLFLIPVACSALYPSLFSLLFYVCKDGWIFFSRSIGWCLLMQLMMAWVLNIS